MIRRMYRVVTIAAATAVLAGCGATSGPTTPAGSPSGDAALGGAPPSAPAAVASKTGGATEDTAPVVLADGRSPVLMKKVDTSAKTITFDLVVLYTGLDAAKQWLKDHPGETEAPPLNGLYLINDNSKLRTLPVSPGVVVKVVEGGDPSTPGSLAFTGLPAFVAGGIDLFWITVKSGVVTLIEQQFVS